MIAERGKRKEVRAIVTEFKAFRTSITFEVVFKDALIPLFQGRKPVIGSHNTFRAIEGDYNTFIHYKALQLRNCLAKYNFKPEMFINFNGKRLLPYINI